ncbi:MAG: hypothetical protein HN995_00845 [Candidatus Marinimicrobia bacterium]|jgi:hypothetical protein|nr:hypothetical protein [Candidatus Neomarinimicrobiota bacterium]MBT3576974.1 hypothetical protein [Candidatus Neomarinimicrobiota bacterium]MBT3680152.1 hypothetical protein [Candidatus Neomarinimicrobiota bacterium]MBT3951363.1 hypothetical protein [Candidatus Neomarinimicrobiota bacterium]MBT4253938.1 hypothetical protein [Candidatus Neomarinimicrobiota bacterium]
MQNTNRVILLLVAIIAGVQIVSGIEGLGTIPIAYYTVSYGIFLISAILMVLMGVDIIEHPIAALAASMLPLGFSMGLIGEFLLEYHLIYSSLISVLYAGLTIQKLRKQDKSALLFQILLHGFSGLVLFILPLVLFIQGEVESNFLGVSVGTGLVAIGGMALAFLKSGKPLLSKDQIYTIFPGVLLLAVVAYSIGIGQG